MKKVTVNFIATGINPDEEYGVVEILEDGMVMLVDSKGNDFVVNKVDINEKI